jgi:DNA-binding transcriptional ArsR family regulator
MTAGDIAGKFDMSFATVSHHLSILKDADLVSDRKEGKYIFYELNSSVIDGIISYIMELKADKNEK